MIGNQLKDYEIISLLGEGGMANVYLGKHLVLGNFVAIKLLKDEYVQHPNIRKRFLAEARSLAKMSHPNIIRVTDLIDAGDIVAFTMDYIMGVTLDAHLKVKEKLTDSEIEGFMKQMISAVDYVHEQGLIHRDIKPSNFIISVKGEVKLLDFGIAKNTNKGAADYTKTGMAQQMGTPLYMSPEQVRSASEITKQTDIYSLGVVLWQMVMNKKPYDSEAFSLPEIQVSILKEPLPLTGTIWDPIIQGATAKNPADRTLDLSKKGISIEHIEVSVKKPVLIPTWIGYAFAILLFLVLIVFSIDSNSEVENEPAYQETPPISENSTSGIAVPSEQSQEIKTNHVENTESKSTLESPKNSDKPKQQEARNTNAAEEKNKETSGIGKLKIGQKYQGGIIFYLDVTGQHGLICSENDQGVNTWIRAVEVSNYYIKDDFGDWYLPSKNELIMLFSKRSLIGYYSNAYYWSSTDDGSKTGVWKLSFSDGTEDYSGKTGFGYIRPIRSF